MTCSSGLNWSCGAGALTCPFACALSSHQVQDAPGEHCGLQSHERPLQVDPNPAGRPRHAPVQPEPGVWHADQPALHLEGSDSSNTRPVLLDWPGSSVLLCLCISLTAPSVHISVNMEQQQDWLGRVADSL